MLELKLTHTFEELYESSTDYQLAPDFDVHVNFMPLLASGGCLGAAAVSEVTRRHVRNPCPLRSAAGAERAGKDVQPGAEAPVLSERLLCRAEQVSEEQLSPSLEANTLWIIAIYPQGLSQWQGYCPVAFLSPLFFVAVEASFLPAKRLPTSSPQLLCLLWRSFNLTAQWLPCAVPQDLPCSSLSDMSTQHQCFRPPPHPPPPSKLQMPWKGIAGSGSVRCTSGWIGHLVQDEGALVLKTAGMRWDQLSEKMDPQGRDDGSHYSFPTFHRMSRFIS